MRGRAAAVALVIAAIALGTWLLATPRGPAARDSAAAPATVAAPDAAPAPAPAAESAPARDGVFEGIVLREGKPAAATITAYLRNRGPADPDSPEGWKGYWIEPDLCEGLDPAPRAETASGADGKWSFRGLGPGVFQFEARSEDGWRGRTGWALRSDGSRARDPGERVEPAEIELQPAPFTLRGRATHLDGTSFRGFIVAGPNWEIHLPVPTDAEGRFRIDGLRESTVQLTALVPGVREVPGPSVILPTTEEIAFAVGSGREEVEGRVVEDATGASLADVRVDLDFSHHLSGTTGAEIQRTDADGRFRLAMYSGGLTGLLVRAPGFVPLSYAHEDLGPRFRSPVVLRLRRPAALSGRVLTADGAAAAGAEVVAVPEAEDPGAGPAGRRAIADAQERFAFQGLPAGAAVVVVAGGGFVSKSLAGPAPWSPREDTVSLSESAPTTRDLVAVPCARIRGRALDTAGNPIPGAEVEIEQFHPESMPWELRPDRKSIADGGGDFVVPFLRPGVAAVLTARDGDRPVISVEAPPLAPGAEGEVVLRAPPERSLRVRVVERGTGRPLARIGVDVSAQFRSEEEEGADALDLDGDWTTDADGNAVVGPVPALPLILRACGSDPWWSSKAVRVRAVEAGPVLIEVHPLEMPGALAVDGLVLLPDGAPAVGAVVEFGKGSDWNCSGFTGNTVATDPAGRFRVSRLHPAEYEIRARFEHHGRSYEGAVEATGGSTQVVVRLEDETLRDAGLEGEGLESRFRVRVLSPSRKPVPSASVLLHYPASDGGWVEEQCTASQGLCAFPLDPPAADGVAWVEVTSTVNPDTPSVPLAHGVFGPFPWTQGEVEVVLAPGRTIEGRVQDASGRGIAHARVDLCSAGIHVTEEETRSAYTWVSSTEADADGRFRVEGAGDRAYRLQAFAPPAWCPSAREFARGGARGVVLVPRAALSVLVTVTDAAGTPIPGANVRAPGRRSGDQQTTNAAGIARIEGLDPAGEHSLVVEPPHSRKDLLEETREGWVIADTVVRLRTGFVLEVFAKDAAGNPVPGAKVRCWPAGGDRTERETAGDDGVARFSRLEPGPVRVEAQLPEDDSGDTRSQPVSVDAGAGRTTVTLDAGLELRAILRDGAKPAGGKVFLAAAGMEEVLRSACPEQGEVRLRGLKPGVEYDLYCYGGMGAGAAVLRGLRADGRPIEIDLPPGREISGRVLLPEGGELRGIALMVGRAPMNWGESDREEGSFRLFCVPEGRWTVRATVVANGEEKRFDVEAAAGSVIEIDARR